MLNNRIDCPALLEKLPIFIPRLETRSKHLFYLNSGRTNLNLQSPINFMCNIYNTVADKCDVTVDSIDKIVDIYVNSIE